MDVQIRPISSKDVETIYHLVENILPVLNREAWISRWHWLHEDNPWRRKDIPLGFVACAGDRLVGHLGLIPVPVRWNGGEIICQSSETFAVDPTYQGRGIGSELASRAWNSHIVPQPVSFTATDVSRHLFDKYGGRAAPAVVNSIRVGTLDVDALFRRLRSKGGTVWRTLRLSSIAIPAKLIARLFLKLKIRSLGDSSGWSIEQIDSGHPLLEDLCLSAFQDNLLSVSVTPAYINWRYEDFPLSAGVSHRTISIRDRSGELRTAAVLGEHVHSDWGGVVGDLMELISDPEVDLSRVLACLMTYGRSRKWTAFRSAFVSPEWDRICRLAGMVRHPGSTNERTTVVKPIRMLKDTTEVFNMASRWKLGMGCRL